MSCASDVTLQLMVGQRWLSGLLRQIVSYNGTKLKQVHEGNFYVRILVPVALLPIPHRRGKEIRKTHTQMFYLRGRGESGWCLDVTSTHGAWRHAGVRFLLPGITYFQLLHAF